MSVDVEGVLCRYAAGTQALCHPRMMRVSCLLSCRELNVSGVYRVPAESLQKQTTLSETGSPDVQLVYGGGRAASTALCHDCLETRIQSDRCARCVCASTELKRPNGLAFSPDSRKLYVANSDGDDPLWMLFHLDERGEVINSSVWKSARPFQQGGSRTGERSDEARLSRPSS